MKTPPEIPGRPYTARELIGMGIVLIIMGLLIALYFYSVYRFGSDAQMVNTKWGTKLMSAIPPESPMNRVLEFSGFGLSILGVIPLVKGMRKRK